jgi:hypothetical protein
MDVLRNGHRKQEIHEHFIEWVNPSNRANSIELTKEQLTYNELQEKIGTLSDQARKTLYGLCVDPEHFQWYLAVITSKTSFDTYQKTLHKQRPFQRKKMSVPLRHEAYLVGTDPALRTTQLTYVTEEEKLALASKLLGVTLKNPKP